mgnify:CR=1 FL=1
MSSSFLPNPSFTQIGSDIDGEANGDNSGSSVSLSSDGSIVAIGAPDNDGNETYSGHVRVYQNVNNIWTQLGSDINGESYTDSLGSSVSLSEDGSTVAIGAPGTLQLDYPKGYVRIYKFDNANNTWTQLGSDINGDISDHSGYSVSLSADGSIVAIGAITHGNYIGNVRIYQNINNTWNKVGGDIGGEADHDYSGLSVSLSSDGSVVAIGAFNNDGNGYDSGHVRIYKNVNDTWTQVGGDIDGEAKGDNSGSSVSLSSDGSVVAIGAPRNIANGYSGHVRVYKNVNNIWTQVGSDIDGEANGDYSGISVSLSSDGSVVAIGASRNEGNGTYSGHVRVYQNINNTWNKVIEDIDGEANGDNSGSSVSLSSDGTIVSIGAPNNDGNGGDSGHVRVYQIHSITLETQTISASELISLDAQYSGTVNASSVNTITGSAADVNSVYASSGITNLGNEAVTISDTSITASVLNTLDGNTSGIVDAGTVTTLTGTAEDINTAYSSNGISFLGNEAVTITDISISASVLNTLDGNTSGIVDAGTVTTLTGSATDINTAYSSNGISNLGNAAVNLSGTNTVSQVNSVAVSMFLANPLTPGLLTATISDNDIDTLSAISDSGNALTINVTDASVNASALTALDQKTSVAVSVSSTTLKGTTAEVNAIYSANTAGTITGLGNEAVTISDTSIDASALKTLDVFTTGIIDASSIRTLTGSDSDKTTVRGSNGITGLPGSLLKIGSDIDGEAADDYSGRSVSLSSNGSVVAIGALYNDGNGDLSGHVRIYKNVNNTWTKIGSDIDGEAADDLSGSSVSLSDDGSVVAIGAYDNDGNGTSSGHVRVYQNVNDTWTKIGEDIDGESSDNYFGSSISLSSDGSIVAIGADFNDGNGTNSGHVRIYKNVNNTWTKVGGDINGEASGDKSGSSVSISSDGSVVAIGAQNNDGNGTNSGHVRVYQNLNNIWTQVGSDIDGEGASDRSGKSISLSANGSVVAIGAPHNNVNGNETGHVRIYKNVNNIWTQVNSDIDGEANNDRAGSSVSLSADGSVIAIGAYSNDDNGSDSGHVRVYSIVDTTATTLTDLEALKYIASNSDLISAFGIDTTAATAHYEDYGKSEGRVLTAFSASDYLANYSDLFDAFGNNETLALKHYIQSGYTEGRTDSSSSSGSSSVSDSSSESSSVSTSLSPTTLSNLEALQYIASNPDLISAFGTNIVSAKSHYTNYGKSEGRTITDFNPISYLYNNSDLATAFGSDTGFAIKHFITNGYSEGRSYKSSSASNSNPSSSSSSSSSSGSTSTSSSGSSSSSSSGSTTTSSPTALSDFQAFNYIASNIDLISVFGVDIIAAKSHYISYGKAEGRPVDNFDEWGYLASNNDLMSALGSNTTEVIKHYISFGKAEGRSTTIFNAESYFNNYADLRSAFGNDQTLAAKHYVENGFNEGRVF